MEGAGHWIKRWVSRRSLLSGAYLTLFPAVREPLDNQGRGEIRLFGGGIISDEGAQRLTASGVGRLFPPGTPTQANIECLDPEAEGLPIVREVRRNVELNSVMSNKFGFGGINACLVFQRFQDA